MLNPGYIGLKHRYLCCMFQMPATTLTTPREWRARLLGGPPSTRGPCPALGSRSRMFLLYFLIIHKYFQPTGVPAADPPDGELRPRGAARHQREPGRGGAGGHHPHPDIRHGESA